MNINIRELYEKIKEIFKIATTIAKDIGFEKRKSKMNAVNFLKASIIGFLTYETPSYNELARIFSVISDGETISKQGFWDRIKPKTIDFLKDFLKKLIEIAIGKIVNIPKLLKYFTQTYIMDSTLIQLPEVLEEKYKGFGGSASKSMMKIQCLFNVNKKSYEKIDLGDIKLADTYFAKDSIQTMDEGSLTLFDLGYVSIEVIKNIIKYKSYFLCRFPFWSWELYDLDNSKKKIDLLNILKNNDGKILDFVASVGKDRVPVRLVAYPLPKDKREEIVKKRLEKAKKNGNFKTRKELNHRYIEFQNWTIYITNAPSEKMKTRDIYKIYRLRWKIELIFKLWKSNLNISDINCKISEKVEYSIFIRLIILTFYFLLINSSSNTTDEEDFEYSDFICICIFKYHFKSFLLSINVSFNRFSKLYFIFLFDTNKYGRKDKSGVRKSLLDILGYHNRGGPLIFNYNNYDISACCSQFKEMYAC